MRVTLNLDPDWSVEVVAESLKQDLGHVMNSYTGSYIDCSLVQSLLATLRFYTAPQDYTEFLSEFVEQCVKGLPDNDRLWRVLFPDAEVDADTIEENPEEPKGC